MYLKNIKVILVITLTLFVGTYCQAFESSKKSYNTSHESLASYDVPQWYSEGKLGIFMHLSAFSVPQFKNEWYATNMYYADDNPNMKHKEYRKSFRDHHEKTYGSLKDFGYKDFIPLLKIFLAKN